MDKAEAVRLGYEKFCGFHMRREITCLRLGPDPSPMPTISGRIDEGLKDDVSCEPIGNGFLYGLKHTHGRDLKGHMYTCDPTNPEDQGDCKPMS